jgi:hypothetical protein
MCQQIRPPTTNARLCACGGMAYNIGRICAGVVFSEQSVRTITWLKILLMMITYNSLIGNIQPKQKPNNEM